MRSILTFLLLGLSILLKAQKFPLDKALPMDPEVKVGTLPNGLKYFIRKNTEPKNRAELRLAVKIGSIVETEEQRGLAHFMEHMNFNGTKNFPKNNLVQFLEKSGIKFGADINAYTSFDETVYQLPVPTDSLALLEKYFSVLADWSGNATLDPEEIDKERGVVLEEARLHKGASQRIQEKLLPVLLGGSHYANRLPIGLESVIQTAPYTEFQRFKEDWYRPDLQAVVAVGDFDPNVIENMIKKYFSEFKNPKNAKPRTKFKVPLREGTQVVVVKDKEQPFTIAQLYYLHKRKKEMTGKDRREAIVRTLFNVMMSMRFSELQKSANPPFQFGSTNYSSFLADLDALSSIVVAKGNDLEGAIKAVMQENARAGKFGFTDTELERAKMSYKSSMEKMYAEKDKTSSINFVEELVEAFLNDLVMTNIAFDKEFLDQYLADISLEEVNKFTNEVFSSKGKVLAVIGPETAELPEEGTFKEWVNADQQNVQAYVDDVVDVPLVQNLPNAGKYVAQKEIKEIGVTELELDNGVKVVLKPTTFKNDEILIRASRWGGTSLYDDIDHPAFASFVASNSGNGPLNNKQLSKFLSGKVVNVSVSVGQLSESVSASSTRKDLETALQMIYNKFTNQNLDAEAVSGALANQIEILKNIEATPTPEKVYDDTLQAVLSQNHPRRAPMTSDRVAKIDAEKALAIYKERFSNANGFVFVLVGAFEVEEIKPLLAQYLGSLPSNGKLSTFRDLGITPPEKKMNVVVKKGKEDKATVTLVYNGTYEGKVEEERVLNALGEILQMRLTEELRENEGEAYSPYATINYSRWPTPRYQGVISFGCAPVNVEKLVAICNSEVEKLVKEGAQEDDIQKYVNNEMLNFETYLQRNAFWASTLLSKYQKGEDVKGILHENDYLKELSTSSTKAAAKKFLSDDRWVQVTLLPEE